MHSDLFKNRCQLPEFLRGVLVMKAKVNENNMFFKAIMNLIPNNIIGNSKLINLKEIPDINKSIGNEQKMMKDFNWTPF